MNKKIKTIGVNRWCIKCEQWLDVGEFGSDKGRYDGLALYCRKCNRDRIYINRIKHAR